MTQGCILLLNGWTPMSVYNRTLLADVVVSGFVHETYKDFRSQDLTYSAKIELVTVYKGQELVDNLTSVAKNTFVISNFGDKKMCYADIQENEMYILFLTVYKRRLSAKYDDIFGAATELTKPREEEILTHLGTLVSSPLLPIKLNCDLVHPSLQHDLHIHQALVIDPGIFLFLEYGKKMRPCKIFPISLTSS